MDETRETAWYVPAGWEGERSPVEGLTMGEFERMADKILRFHALTLDEKLRSLLLQQREQRWLDTLTVLRHGA